MALPAEKSSTHTVALRDPVSRKPRSVHVRKKIGILTFHRCINYGAYWQVRCLSDFLTAQGHDVDVLDYRSTRYFWNELRHALRPFPQGPITDVVRFLGKTLKFLRAQQELKRSSMFPLTAPPNFSHYDVIVVGSDEVWNLRHAWLGGVPLFFGEQIMPRRLVSYAASFGNHDANTGLSPEWIKRLHRFDDISVRDANSLSLVERHLGRTPAFVLDPCLQFLPRARSVTSLPSEPAYLLVYGNQFKAEFVSAVKNWARAQNLRTVSIGYRNDWADVSIISAGPEEFVHRFQHAQAVATSYFHGCVFALRFQRPFCAQLSDYRAIKISDLLSSLGASHRIYEDGKSHRVPELLSTPLESEVMTKIAQRRADSFTFINSWLKPLLVAVLVIWVCRIVSGDRSDDAEPAELARHEQITGGTDRT